MRISTNSMLDTGVSQINRAQAELSRVGSQIASGTRLANAADDPVAAAQVSALTAAKSRNDQFASNQIQARNALSFTESVLGQVGDIYERITELTVQAGNGALGNSDRASIAQDLSAQRDSLLGLANQRDADHNYMFSGYQDSRQAFVYTASGLSYQGDAGGRALQVSASRQMGVNQNGEEIFGRIRDGNGVFSAMPDAGNTGAATLGATQVSDATVVDGKSYRLVFGGTASAPTYDVMDVAAGRAVSTGNAFVAGQAINVAGMSVTINGKPAAGDGVTLAPSGTRTVFDALDQAISLLRTPVGDSASRARLQAGMASFTSQMNQAADRAINARGAAGAALHELDALTSANQARDVQYQEQLSRLRDLDYAKASADLAQRQMVLSATQQAYAKIFGQRSLFDLI
jgi:flagellar hook-associated protein 3 FlgL